MQFKVQLRERLDALALQSVDAVVDAVAPIRGLHSQVAVLCDDAAARLRQARKQGEGAAGGEGEDEAPAVAPAVLQVTSAVARVTTDASQVAQAASTTATLMALTSSTSVAAAAVTQLSDAFRAGSLSMRSVLRDLALCSSSCTRCFVPFTCTGCLVNIAVSAAPSV